MARVACFMMQKNETLLLEPWLKHHGNLFGYRNLHVYDNGSTIPEISSILAYYENIGVNVYREYSKPDDFNGKGFIIGEKIRSLQSDNSFDFYFPMDCDEFVCVTTNHRFSGNSDQVNDYLNERIGSNSILRTSHCLMNVPGSLDTFALIGHYKCIVPASDFIDIDHGFHEARSISGKDWKPCDIVYVHLHNKPFPNLLENARDKLVPFVDTTDLNALREFDGVGNHLKKYFFDYENVYYDSLHYAPRVSSDVMLDIVDRNKIDRFLLLWENGTPPKNANMIANVLLPQPIDAVAYANDVGIPATQAELLVACYLHKYHQDRLFPETLYKKGLEKIAQRTWNDGVDVWAAYRELEPSRVDGYSLGVLCLREASRFEEAEQLGSLAMAMFPHDSNLYLECALISFPARDWETARTRFRTMRERFPDHTEGYVRGGIAARELGLFHEAQALLALGMHRFPNDPVFYLESAYLFEMRGEPSLALWMLDLLEEKCPGHPAQESLRERLTEKVAT